MTFLSDLATAIVVGLMLQSSGSAVDWSQLDALAQLGKEIAATETPASTEDALPSAEPSATDGGSTVGLGTGDDVRPNADQASATSQAAATSQASTAATPAPIPTIVPSATTLPIVSPTPQPTAAAWPVWLSASQVSKDVSRLVASVYVSFDGTTDYNQLESITDNPQTHLLARWVDFRRAQIVQDSALQVESITLIKPGEPQLRLEGNKAVSTTGCDLSYSYAGAASTEQLALAFTIEYTHSDSTTTITQIDVVGEPGYEELKAAALAEGGGTLTVEAIDKVVDARIAAMEAANATTMPEAVG